MIMYFMAAGYFILLALFAYYGWLNVRQTKVLEDWNRKTDVEIRAIRDRNLELEKRLGELERKSNETEE